MIDRCHQFNLNTWEHATFETREGHRFFKISFFTDFILKDEGLPFAMALDSTTFNLRKASRRSICLMDKTGCLRVSGPRSPHMVGNQSDIDVTWISICFLSNHPETIRHLFWLWSKLHPSSSHFAIISELICFEFWNVQATLQVEHHWRAPQSYGSAESSKVSASVSSRITTWQWWGGSRACWWCRLKLIHSLYLKGTTSWWNVWLIVL